MSDINTIEFPDMQPFYASKLLGQCVRSRMILMMVLPIKISAACGLHYVGVTSTKDANRAASKYKPRLEHFAAEAHSASDLS